MLDVISIQTDKKIDIKEFNSDQAPDIYGCVIEKEKSVVIYVNKGLNFCYRRFVVAKELSHLLMNTLNHELRNITTKNNILDLISFLTIATDSGAKSLGEESEDIAFFGAMELLIPKQYFLSEWFKSNTNNNQNIAVQIKCPTQAIEIRKSENISKKFTKVYNSEMINMARIIDLFNRTKVKGER